MILDELVREGALVGFRTNFDDRGLIWVPTVSIQVAETADLPSVLSSHLLVGPRMAVSLGIELHNSVMDGAVEV